MYALDLFPQGDPKSRDALYEVPKSEVPKSDLPIVRALDLAKYHGPGSLAARVAMQNGYVLDDSSGRIVGRVDVAEVLAILRAAREAGTTQESASRAPEGTSHASEPVVRESGFVQVRGAPSPSEASAPRPPLAAAS